MRTGRTLIADYQKTGGGRGKSCNPVIGNVLQVDRQCLLKEEITVGEGQRFAQFHGKQALVLFILEIAASILKVVPALGDLVFTVAFVVFGILSLIGITKVLMGEKWEMPVVFEISNRISF